MIGILGSALIVALAVLLSEQRSAVRFVDAGKTYALIVAVALIAILTPVGTAALSTMSAGVSSIIVYAQAGIEFVYGSLADPRNGFVLAFQILPIIVFIASLVSVLFHIGVMKWVIRLIGGALSWVTGASRLEATCAAANIFVGMIEAPLTILPYLPKMSRSQIFVLMSCGLSSVAGTVLVAYAAMGIDLNLLLIAAFLGAPGGLLFGRLLVPETEEPFDITSAPSAEEDPTRAGSVIEAATEGAITGMQIMINVTAILIAFIGIIALLNGIIGGLGSLAGVSDLSLQLILGYIFAPLMFLVGVPWEEAIQAGNLFGQKLVVSEFIAYTNFSSAADTFGPQATIAITIALCGFANLGGAGILVAGLSSVMPERRAEISKLGFKAVVAGSLSNLNTAAIVSVIYAVKALF